MSEPRVGTKTVDVRPDRVDLRDREMDIGFRLVSPATKPY